MVALGNPLLPGEHVACPYWHVSCCNAYTYLRSTWPPLPLAPCLAPGTAAFLYPTEKDYSYATGRDFSAMSVAIAGEPCVLRATPGRLRVHLPNLAHLDPPTIDTQLRKRAGVRRVEANALTGNILVYFDPRATTDQQVLTAIRA